MPQPTDSSRHPSTSATVLVAPQPVPLLWRAAGLQVGLAPGPVWLLQGSEDELRRTARVIAGSAAAEPAAATTRALQAAGLLVAPATPLRRRAAVIEIRGGDRLASRIALAGAENGSRVLVVDRRPVRPGDVVAGALSTDDIGRPRGVTLTERLSGPAARPVGPETRRDLVILADGSDLDPAATDPLLRTGTPHLVARCRGGVVQLGPLVIPGSTACLRCLDLHRTDADPEWPALAIQLLRSSEETVTDSQARVTAGFAAEIIDLAGSDDRSEPGEPESRLYRIPARGLPWAEPVHRHPACGCCWTGAAVVPDRRRRATISG